MKSKKIDLTLAIRDRSEEERIRNSLSGHGGFRVSSIATATRIPAARIVNTDLLIVCNDVLAQNAGFRGMELNCGANALPIFAASNRDRLGDIGRHLGRVTGCVLLDGDLGLLPSVARMAAGGYCVLPANLREAFIDFRAEQASIAELSLIECALLQGLGRGRSEPEIAKDLNLYESTVHRLVHPLLTTLRIPDRQEARAFAVRHKQQLYQRRRRLIRQQGIVASAAKI